MTRATIVPGVKNLVRDISAIESGLILKTEVDMQALANELNRAAKLFNEPFNKLVRDRTPHIVANLEKSTLQDLVVVLSAFGLRISRSGLGSKELMRS